MGHKPRTLLDETECAEWSALVDELAEDLANYDRLEEAIDAAFELLCRLPKDLKMLRGKLEDIVQPMAENLRRMTMGEPLLAPVPAPVPAPALASGAPSARVSLLISIPQAIVDQEILSQGIVVAFFTRNLISKDKKSLERVFDLWLETVPPEALGWAVVGGNSTTARQVNKRVLGRCRAQFSAKVPRPAFRIGGPAKDNPVYALRVSAGVADKDELSEFQGANAISARFPANAAASDIEDLALKVAGLLNYSTGVAGPALFVSNHGMDSRAGMADVYGARLLARHPGLVGPLDGFRLGDKCFGPRWLTFLGAKQVVALGGFSRIASSLPNSHVAKAGTGTVVRTGEGNVGDLLAGNALPEMRPLALLLKPVTVDDDFYRGRITFGDDDIWTEPLETLRQEWPRRFLSDTAALANLARKLEHLTRTEELAEALVTGGVSAARDTERLAAALDAIPFVSSSLKNTLPDLAFNLYCQDSLESGAGATIVETAGGEARLLQVIRKDTTSDKHLEYLHFLVASFKNRETTTKERKLFGYCLLDVGARLLTLVPNSVATVVTAAPKETSDSNWDYYLAQVNNRLVQMFDANENIDAAETMADAVAAMVDKNPYLGHSIACIYVKKGRLDDALEQVELAAKHGYEHIARIGTDSDLEALWSHPRFSAVLPKK